MNAGERDLKLKLFLRYVADGTPPPQKILEFVAEGVRESLKGGASPWHVKTGRTPVGTRHTEQLLMVSCYLLDKINVPRDRIALISGLIKTSGEDYNKTLGRYIKGGRSSSESAGIGSFLCGWAIEDLVENKPLARDERQKLEDLRIQLIGAKDDEPLS
jgi:hypothetical protein